MTALNCYKSSCNGTLRASSTDTQLFECDNCGGSLDRPAVETLAAESGPVAQLAQSLLETADTEHTNE